MKWRLVVTQPFHLRGHFLADYRAGSRGDYLPTGIYLIYVRSFCFCRRQAPLSQTLLHIACRRPPGGADGATLHVMSTAPWCLSTGWVKVVSCFQPVFIFTFDLLFQLEGTWFARFWFLQVPNFSLESLFLLCWEVSGGQAAQKCRSPLPKLVFLPDSATVGGRSETSLISDFFDLWARTLDFTD